MRVKHPRLDRNEDGELIFYCPSQSKERNTESTYIISTDTLIMAGVTVEKHPKFKNIDQFEDWCNVYWAKQ